MTSTTATTGPTAGAVTAGDAETPGEAALLVSEFPPPPFYYKRAVSLTPPQIPTEALSRGTRRAAAAAAKAKAEAERMRLQSDDADKTGAILGGEPVQEEEEGDVVAVFGEVVEDPMLFKPEDPCEDPTLIGDEVKRLNRESIAGFVKLVDELVHRPLDNKKQRDELAHNVFRMLQESNKFREHQAREALIELLEKELDERRRILANLHHHTSEASELLESSRDL